MTPDLSGALVPLGSGDLPPEIEASSYLRPITCTHCGRSKIGRPDQIFCSNSCHFEWRRNRGCEVAACIRTHYGHGLCQKHYLRLKKTGSVLSSRDFVVVAAEAPMAAVFGAPVLPPRTWRLLEEVENGCWRYTGKSTNQEGHGKAKIAGRQWGVHRLTYTVFIGPIPDGLYLDHFRYPENGCLGPSCGHPEHVRPATPRENTLRGEGPTSRNLAKTHCGTCGNPLSGSNLMLNKNGRACRFCSVANTRAWRARQREASEVAS